MRTNLDGNRRRLKAAAGLLGHQYWLMGVALIALLSSSAAGLAVAGLISLIDRILKGQVQFQATPAANYLALTLISVCGASVGGILTSFAGEKLICEVRTQISRAVAKVNLETIETYKRHRLLTILSTDIDTISAFLFSVPSLAVSSALVFDSLYYALTVSGEAFFVMLGTVTIVTAIPIILNDAWTRDTKGIRSLQENIQRGYDTIINGCKEIRLNRRRLSCEQSLRLEPLMRKYAATRTMLIHRYWVADGIANGAIFAGIAVILLRQNGLSQTAAHYGALTLMLLYLRAPVEQILNAVPVALQALTSYRKVTDLYLSMVNDPTLEGSEGLPGEFQVIEVHNITYHFPDVGDQPGFHIGPISLSFSPGEIIFFTGQNGCGKTSLLKLLCGLYRPNTGDIFVDGDKIQDIHLSRYRSLFSSVFSDFHLFDSVLSDRTQHFAVDTLIRYVGLQGKVAFIGANATTTDLSAGQRRRLALISALLEDRPVIVLDEFAADQDPKFRKFFYSEILPSLKRLGKLVLLVSHDSQYFEYADRVIDVAFD